MPPARFSPRWTAFPPPRPPRPRRGSIVARLAALVGLISLVSAAYLGATGFRASATSAGLTLPPALPVWALSADAPAPTPPRARRLCEVRITVTGYSSTESQTDSTPFITAANTRVRPGVLALSRDLLREFTPGAPFGFGDWVEIRGVGKFTVEDTMNPRYRKRADIWFEHASTARTWGRQNRTLVKLVPRIDDARPAGAPARDLAAAPFEAPGFVAALAD